LLNANLLININITFHQKLLAVGLIDGINIE
jgi:hypothetical protein